MLRYVRWLRLQTLDKVSPRRYVLTGGAIVAVVAGLGALDTFGVISVKALDLDGEKNVPAFTSGFLLLGAAFAAGAFWLATGIDGRSRWERGAALVMAACSCTCRPTRSASSTRRPSASRGSTGRRCSSRCSRWPRLRR